LIDIEWSDNLDALKSSHRTSLDVPLKRQARKSADIDEQFRKHGPNANRWDYLLEIAVNARATASMLALEVHTADHSEVKVLIRKKEWTKEFLRSNTTVGVDRWVWAASGKVNIPKTGKYPRQLAKAGIEFPVRVVR
jgi:hypothetical protein